MMTIAPRKPVQGFTLIEALIAIAIITLSISGPLWAAGNSLRVAQVAQDQLTASSLAQEGVEYVRAVRDNDYLAAYKADKNFGGASTDGWNAFLADVNSCKQASGGCYTNMGDWDHPYPGAASPALVSCAGSCSTKFLKLKTSGSRYLYNYSSGTATLFARTITVDSVGSASAPAEQVVSTVVWSKQGRTYSVSTVDDVTPWQ